MPIVIQKQDRALTLQPLRQVGDGGKRGWVNGAQPERMSRTAVVSRSYLSDQRGKRFPDESQQRGRNASTGP